MRIWSIHPCYLDARGLVALWRESLLAQAVLQGKTSGYKNHPQLDRFKNTNNPEGAIAEYLRHILAEADTRGYKFDRSKISTKIFSGKILVTSGQIEYEFQHLLGKLQTRNPKLHEKLKLIKTIKIHPLLQKVSGDIEDWETI